MRGFLFFAMLLAVIYADDANTFDCMTCDRRVRQACLEMEPSKRVCTEQQMQDGHFARCVGGPRFGGKHCNETTQCGWKTAYADKDGNCICTGDDADCILRCPKGLGGPKCNMKCEESGNDCLGYCSLMQSWNVSAVPSITCDLDKFPCKNPKHAFFFYDELCTKRCPGKKCDGLCYLRGDNPQCLPMWNTTIHPDTSCALSKVPDDKCDKECTLKCGPEALCDKSGSKCVCRSDSRSCMLCQDELISDDTCKKPCARAANTTQSTEGLCGVDAYCLGDGSCACLPGLDPISNCSRCTVGYDGERCNEVMATEVYRYSMIVELGPNDTMPTDEPLNGSNGSTTPAPSSKLPPRDRPSLQGERTKLGKIILPKCNRTWSLAVSPPSFCTPVMQCEGNQTSTNTTECFSCHEGCLSGDEDFTCCKDVQNEPLEATDPPEEPDNYWVIAASILGLILLTLVLVSMVAWWAVTKDVKKQRKRGKAKILDAGEDEDDTYDGPKSGSSQRPSGSRGGRKRSSKSNSSRREVNNNKSSSRTNMSPRDAGNQESHDQSESEAAALLSGR